MPLAGFEDVAQRLVQRLRREVVLGGFQYQPQRAGFHREITRAIHQCARDAAFARETRLRFFWGYLGERNRWAWRR